MMRLEVYRCSAKFRTINYFMVGYISQIVVQLEIKASFLSRNFFFRYAIISFFYSVLFINFIFGIYWGISKHSSLYHLWVFYSWIVACLHLLALLIIFFLSFRARDTTTQPGPLLWNYNNFLSLNNNNDSVYCCCWCWVDIPPIFIFIFSFPPVLLISHGLFNYYITTVYGRCYYCYYCFRRPFSDEMKRKAFELFFSFYVYHEYVPFNIILFCFWLLFTSEWFEVLVNSFHFGTKTEWLRRRRRRRAVKKKKLLKYVLTLNINPSSQCGINSIYFQHLLPSLHAWLFM